MTEIERIGGIAEQEQARVSGGFVAGLERHGRRHDER